MADDTILFDWPSAGGQLDTNNLDISVSGNPAQDPHLFNNSIKPSGANASWNPKVIFRASPRDGYRVEVEINDVGDEFQLLEFGANYKFRFYLRRPANWDNRWRTIGGMGGTFFQVHGRPDVGSGEGYGRNPNFALRYADKEDGSNGVRVTASIKGDTDFIFDGDWTDTETFEDLTPPASDTWVKVEIEYKPVWDKVADGNPITRVWFDDVAFIDDTTTRNAYNDANPPYPKFGIYAPPWKGAYSGQPSDGETREMYFGPFMATKNGTWADLDAVDPVEGGTPPPSGGGGGPVTLDASQVTETASNVTSLQLTIPAGSHDGKVATAEVVSRSSTQTFDLANSMDGWTYVGSKNPEVDSDPDGQGLIGLWWKVLGASETNPTVTVTASNRIGGVIKVWGGADTTAPIEDHSFQGLAINVDDGGGQVTTAAEAAINICLVSPFVDVTAGGEPTGYTVQKDDQINGTDFPWWASAYKVETTGANYDPAWDVQGGQKTALTYAVKVAAGSGSPNPVHTAGPSETYNNNGDDADIKGTLDGAADIRVLVVEEVFGDDGETQRPSESSFDAVTPVAATNGVEYTFNVDTSAIQGGMDVDFWVEIRSGSNRTYERLDSCTPLRVPTPSAGEEAKMTRDLTLALTQEQTVEITK